MKKNDHPQVLLPPVLIFFAFLAVAAVLEYRFGFDYPKAPIAFRLPTTLILVGYSAYLSIYSMILLKRNGNSMNPRKPTVSLVEKGPFSFSRNPMYLSLVTGFLSLAVWFYSMWFFFFSSMLLGVLDFTAVGPEEKYLKEKFGDAYTRYQSNVSRWI